MLFGSHVAPAKGTGVASSARVVVAQPTLWSRPRRHRGERAGLNSGEAPSWPEPAMPPACRSTCNVPLGWPPSKIARRRAARHWRSLPSRRHDSAAPVGTRHCFRSRSGLLRTCCANARCCLVTLNGLPRRSPKGTALWPRVMSSAAAQAGARGARRCKRRGRT